MALDWLKIGTKWLKNWVIWVKIGSKLALPKSYVVDFA
jgi:hypothetical protein